MMLPFSKLVLATTNNGKARELRELLPGVEILTLTDVHFRATIEEPHDSFAENARAKAQAVFAVTGLPVLADDSGLCVDALGGAPGVHSARYAGEPQNTVANKAKLLSVMRGIEDRRAQFVAALALCDAHGCRIFEGSCRGSIAHAPSGTGGFGYDPIFIPEGYDETFGTLPSDVKARLSHRAKALQQMVAAFRPASI